MKKGLRFIVALLTLASLGVGFIPVLELAGIRVSVVDVFKVGIGYYDKNSLEGMIYAGMQTYVEPYAWFIAGAAGIILIETVLIAVLRKKAAYITGLIVSLINIGAFLAVFFILREKFSEIQSALIMISADQALELSYIPLFAWIAVYALAFILSMIGLILWRKPKEENAEEVYLEQISRAEEERARRQSEQKKRSREQEPNRVVRRQTGDVQKPEDYSRPGQEPPYADQNYRNPEMMHPEQEPSVWAPPEQKNEVPVSGRAAAEPVHPVSQDDFSGAISGESGLYEGKVYPLTDKKEVFFSIKEGNAVLSPYEEEGAAAGIYYIREYGEYCAEPFEKRAVFLESGQPLGKGRQYYLPRGTKIYVGSRENSFTLV